jgi:HSP20 family protein
MAIEIERWEPWHEFAKLQKRLMDMLEEFFSRAPMAQLPRKPDFCPAVDMYESVRGLVVRAALPGVVEEDIDVTFEEGALTVRGESPEPLDVLEGAERLKEWRYGYFERRVLLPAGYDRDRAIVEYVDGVLEVIIPRE